MRHTVVSKPDRDINYRKRKIQCISHEHRCKHIKPNISKDIKPNIAGVIEREI